MRLGRAALWLAGAAAAVAAAAAAAVLSFDLDSWRDEAAEALSAAAGRAVSLEGPLSLAVSLRPTLVVEGATLGNPPGMSRPEFARIGRLEAQARLWPLLRGRLEVTRLAVSGADLRLERDAEGRPNWAFPAAEGGGRGAALPPIDELLVERSTVAWWDASEATAVEIERLVARRRGEAVAAELAALVDGRRLEAAGDFSLSESAVAASGLLLRSDGIEAAGDLALDLAAAQPRLAGALAFGPLDLDRLAPPSAAGADGRLIPDLRLDDLPLHVLDLDLKLGAARLRAGGLEFEEPSAQVELTDGRLAVRRLAAGLAGGRLSAEGEARVRSDRALAAKLDLDLAQAEFARLAPGGPLAGRFDFKAELRGAGRGLRPLVATLAGEARLLARDGRIAGRALDLAAADLVRLLAPWSERGADTSFSCMLMATAIRQGRAEVEALALDADRVLVTGTGAVDLGRERLDLRLTPRPKEASLFSLATPVNVRGPLRAPSVAPDEAGLLRGGAAALLGNLVLPGAGFLLPFVSAGAGDHPCAATLAPAKRDAARPRRQEEGVGGLLRDLGRGIDRALGTGR